MIALKDQYLNGISMDSLGVFSGDVLWHPVRVSEGTQALLAAQYRSKLAIVISKSQFFWTPSFLPWSDDPTGIYIVA